MGTLKSHTNWSGMIVNEVTLGEPVEVDGWYEWDDSAYPNGIIDADGHIFIEEADDDA